MDMKKNEPLKFPDGTQLSRTALEAMGLSPTNTRQFMLQMYQNRDMGMMMNPTEKLSAEVRDRQIRGDNVENSQENQGRHEEQQRRQEEAQRRMVENNDARAYQQMTFNEKKEFEEKLAEKREADERANANIAGGFGGLMKFGLGMGLTVGALDAVSSMAGPGLSSLGGPLMVASTGNGGLLASLRENMGIEQKPGQDILLKGPGQTANFTPGAPAPEAPGIDAPGMGPQQRQPGLMGMNMLKPPTPFGMN